jgi:hypothetical protein
MKLSTALLHEPSYRPVADSFRTSGVQPPPIPFERCERPKDKSNENVSVFKLRTIPANDESPTYDMKVLTFKSGTVEEYVQWKKDLMKICTGQNVNDAVGKYAMTRRLLDGDALAAFNKAATAAGNETLANYNTVMKALAVHVFPKNALAIQRQWFRRYMKKTNKYTMREYVARVIEMNAMMVEFPPAFNDTQLIKEEEMKDLLEFSVPWAWRIEMVKQAFRPLEHDIADIVEFCERQELCESVMKALKNGNSATSRSTGGSKKPPKIRKERATGRTNKHKRQGRCASYNESGGRDGCREHPDAVTHTTAECRVVQAKMGNGNFTTAARSRGMGSKRQRTSEKMPDKFRPSGGDLHTLLDSVQKVKERLEKEIRQNAQQSGKRKRDVHDNAHKNTDAEIEQNAKVENVSVSELDNFNMELEQLSLSGVDDDDLDNLEPLSESEFEA